MTGEVQACGCFVNRHPDTLAHMHTPSRPAPLSLSWTGQWGRWLAAVPVPWNPAACAHMQKCVSICGRGGWPLSQRVYRASQIHSLWFDGQRVCHLRLIIFGKVTWICDIKYTNISLFPPVSPPTPALSFSPSHRVSRSFRFPLLLCNYRSYPWALCFPHFLLPLFLPPTTLLFVHLMPFCPCPKAPWVGGRGQKQKAGLLAWRWGHWPDAERSKGHWVLWLSGGHFVDVWCWNAAQDKGLTALLFRMVDSQCLYQTRARCWRLGSTYYIVYTLHCGCKVTVCSLSVGVGDVQHKNDPIQSH